MKKKTEEKISFVDALRGVADSKGLSDEEVVHALEEAIVRAYIKYLGGWEDTNVVCHVDPITGHVDLAQVKKVVDEVKDDYVEISTEEANEGLKSPKYAAGDDYYVVCPVEDISKVTTNAIKNNFRQKLAEAERGALYKIYKDKVGEMLVGTVEKTDDKSVTVSIGTTFVELSKKELIGNEIFRIGDQIKVYIQEVKSANPIDGKPSRGPQIEATRSSEGFLKKLFEEEIHEIYDGTVVIKAIARQAGIRSKVAVASTKADVDATGACIGQGGSRIQKIVQQLGNGSSKEKIDIVNYSYVPGFFIIEACRPAEVIGLNLDEENKEADVIIKDGTLPVSYGKKMANLFLASKLTGYKLNMIEESKAKMDEIEYLTYEEWQKLDEEDKRQKEKQAFIKEQEEKALEQARKEEEARKAKEEAERLEKEKALEEAKKQEEENQVEAKEKEVAPTPKVAPKASATPDMFPLEATNPAKAALEQVKAQKALEEEASKVKEEETVASVKEESVTKQTIEVKTTTSLDDLEKELESAKEKKTKSGSKLKRPRKITEEEVKREVTKPVVQAVPVYTDEELSAIEEEESNLDYDDIDESDIDDEYSEYDQYYDDDGK